ncbi:MAG: molybdenum cofactor guanylyltransferase [Rhodothermaceae bacterium]|nr:molybdenum cofactor guanylyltransferase [Rhodothermaceae bacterium]
MNRIKDIYILCGGHSSRMGRDKSGLIYEGKTLLERIANRTLPLFDTVTLLGANNYLESGLRQIPDAIDDAGPLGGLLAALLDTKEDTIALLPVDLPLISDDTITKLSVKPDLHLDALIAGSSSRVQPLLGQYKTRTATVLHNYLNTGKRSVMGFLDLIDHQTFAVDEQEITNINTPDQYEKLTERKGTEPE